MNETIAVRIIELVIGAYLITLHVLTGKDSLIILIGSLMLGVSPALIQKIRSFSKKSGDADESK